MRANRFYTIPYDARNDTKVLKLGKRQRGKMLAYGRWQALLGMLYDEDGLIDLSDQTTELIVRDELEFKNSDQLERFLGDCAASGLISAELWEGMRHVASEGVSEQIEFKAAKAQAGRRGGKAGKGKAAADAGAVADA